MMKMLIKESTKGAKGSQYLIADVGTADTPKQIGVHSKRVPKFVLPDSHIQHTTQIMEPCRNHLTCRVGDARKKMRPDMMVVEMTDTEQHMYLPHDTDTGSRLPNLQPTMPSSKPRKIMIVEGGYCSDVSYLEKAKEKGQQQCQAGGSTEAIWIRCHRKLPFRSAGPSGSFELRYRLSKNVCVS